MSEGLGSGHAQVGRKRADSDRHHAEFARTPLELNPHTTREPVGLDGFQQFEVRRFGNFVAVLAHRRKVHFHRLRHSRSGLLQGAPGRHTAGKVGCVGAIPSGGLLKKNQEFVHSIPACFIIDFCVLAHLVGFVSCNRDLARLIWMNELTMTAFLILQNPTVPPNQPEHVTELHDADPIPPSRSLSRSAVYTRPHLPGRQEE